MTVTTTDFSGYTSNAQPTGWTTRYSTTSHTWRVVDAASATGLKQLRGKTTSTTNYRNAISWDDHSAENIDIIVRLKATDRNVGSATNFLHAGVFARGSGASGSEQLYSFALYATNAATTVGLSKFVSGTETSLGTSAFAWSIDTFYWLRLFVNGTTIKGKVWSGALEDQPVDWTVSVTDAAVSGSGWVGAWRHFNNDNSYDFDIFSVETGVQALTGVESTSAAEATAGVLTHGQVLDGVASISSAEARPGKFGPVVDQVLSGVASVSVSESISGNVSIGVITTEQEDGSHPLLPTLEGLSSFFTGIRMDGDLPGVSIESRFAARMEGVLPSLELSAELLPGGMITMEGRLPSLSFTEGRFGARSDDLKLPSISIESEMITGSIMALDGKFPAAGIESRFGSVASGTFPAISIETSMTGGGVLTLDGRISVLSVESKFGSRLEGDLPGLTIESGLTRTGGLMSLEGDLSSINFIEGRFGVRANGDLPGISLESVMIAGGLMSLDQNIPPLSIESVFGARTEDMKLPAFSLESSLSAKTMTLDGRLPGVVLSGEFLPGGGFMSLAGNISSLSLEASMTSGGIISLSGKIPTIRIEPSALTWEAILSMADGILPAILLESSMYATMMELDGVIPTLVSGAHIGTVSTLSKVSRFDNYVLRHVR